MSIPNNIGEISFGATYVYTSEQISSYATLPQWGVLPASNLVDVNANWRNVLGAPTDLAFFMTNVTNEKIPVSVANGYYSFGIESQGVNEPRMWGFRMRYRFGGR